MEPNVKGTTNFTTDVVLAILTENVEHVNVRVMERNSVIKISPEHSLNHLVGAQLKFEESVCNYLISVKGFLHMSSFYEGVRCLQCWLCEL